MSSISKLLKNKKARFWGLIVMVVYFFLYLWSINYLQFGSFQHYFSTFWLDNWAELMTKRIAPFLYEPIGYIELLKSIRLLVAPVNMIMGFLLSLLVFLNIALVIYMYTLPKQCRIDTKFSGLIGILPSFLTGFACCAPSILIPLASILGSTTAFLSKIFIWLLPISVLLLLYSAISGLRKIGRLP